MRTNDVPHPDLDAVREHVVMRPGAVLIEAAPVVRAKRGLIVSDRTAARLNANVGVVLACRAGTRFDEEGDPTDTPEEMDIAPGGVVLFHPKDGKRCRGGRFGSYETANTLVFIGANAWSGGTVIPMCWSETVMASIEEDIIAKGRHVRIELGELVAKSKGGILLPDTVQKREPEGTVHSVGAIAKRRFPELEPGVRVVFNEKGLNRVFVDDREEPIGLIDVEGVYTVLI